MQYSASRSVRRSISRSIKVVNDWVLHCCAVVGVQGESRTLQPLGYNAGDVHVLLVGNSPDYVVV